MSFRKVRETGKYGKKVSKCKVLGSTLNSLDGCKYPIVVVALTLKQTEMGSPDVAREKVRKSIIVYISGLRMGLSLSSICTMFSYTLRMWKFVTKVRFRRTSLHSGHITE